MSAVSPAGVRVRAPGKINVFLEVGDVKDDGYHDVATAYQAVSLYEEIVATPADDITIEVSGRRHVDVDGVPVDERNLAVRAARLLAETAGVDRGAHLSVRIATLRRSDALSGSSEREQYFANLKEVIADC